VSKRATCVDDLGQVILKLTTALNKTGHVRIT